MTGTDPAEAAAVPAGLELAELLAPVSTRRLLASLAALAGDRLAGRRVGSPGGAAAQDWLGRRLTDIGAAVDRASFPVPAVPEVYAVPVVAWFDGRETYRLVFGRQVAVHPASADAPGVRQGGLGIAGAGDPAGRWLAVPAGMSLIEAYGRADGAAGLLLRVGVDDDGWQYTMLAGRNRGPVPVLALDPDTHGALTQVARTGSGWLSGSAPMRRRDNTGTNLYGRWSWPAEQAVEVLLTAHYDGVGDHPGLRQPGAADNASGVAVVLEAARVLASAAPPGIRSTVALLDAEEVGALGSAHHAAQLADIGAAPLVINVDGAARLRGAVAVEAGGPAHGLLAAVDQAGRHTGLPLVAGPVASDNRRYAAAGLAAVGIGAGMAGYHSPADTADRVDPATMAALTRLVVATVWFATTSHATLIANRR